MVEAVLSAQDEPQTVEVRFEHADGSWCWIEATMRNRLEDDVIFLQAGNPAVYRGEERDTVRNNRRSVADRLPTPNATYMNVRFYI